MPAVKSSADKNPPDAESTRIPWHPAFIEALQMELRAYRDVLEFHPEYQLTTEPLRIDCVVIKKAKDAVIKKNIAVIFRDWNLLEYKSPGDYVSVSNFYKVYGYACLYASINKVPITSLTISFIESHYPKRLLEHLKNERGYEVAETSSGIYTVKGDILPIQVIDGRRLPEEENLWLKNLSDELGREEITRMGDEFALQDKDVRLKAYLNAVTLANPKSVEEAIKMNEKLTLDKVFEETGLAAEWEAKGEAICTEKIARKALAQGATPDFVQKITGLDIKTITSLN